MPQWFCDEPMVLLSGWLDDFRLSAQHHGAATKVSSAPAILHPLFTSRLDPIH